MPVFRIHDHTFGILPEGVHLLAGLNDLSRAIDESVRSAEVHGPLPYVENDDANPTCAGRLLAQSRHGCRCRERPLSGVKQTCRLGQGMSASDPKRTLSPVRKLAKFCATSSRCLVAKCRALGCEET